MLVSACFYFFPSLRNDAGWLGVMMDREGNWTEEELNDNVNGDITITAEIVDLTRTLTWIPATDVVTENSTGGSNSTDFQRFPFLHG